MSYSILRFEKRTGGTIRAIESHHERLKDYYASNPDIDQQRVPLNYHLHKPDATYYQEINRRIEHAGCKVRSNSIKFVDTLITSDNEFFQTGSEQEYFERAYDFMCEKVGKDNIISAVVHMDEKTPHMHLCFTPITTDNRLTAREILGNKAKMSKWQDEFHAHMVKYFPQLQRGKTAADTGRNHIPVALFKKATALTKQLKSIEDALQDINMVNAGKKRDKAIQLLRSWFPQAGVFLREIEQLKSAYLQFQQTEKVLRTEIQTLQENSYKKQQEQYKREGSLMAKISGMEKTVKRYQNFIALIPPDTYSQLKREYDSQQLRHAMQDMDYEQDDD